MQNIYSIGREEYPMCELVKSGLCLWPEVDRLRLQTEPDGNVLHDPKPGPGRAAGAWSAAWLVAWRDEAQDAKSGTEAECSSATRRPQPVRPRRLIYQHKLVRE